MHSLEQTAKRLGVSIHTLRAWVRERRIPFHRIGRRVLVADQDIEDLLAQSRVEAVKR